MIFWHAAQWRMIKVDHSLTLTHSNCLLFSNEELNGGEINRRFIKTQASDRSPCEETKVEWIFFTFVFVNNLIMCLLIPQTGHITLPRCSLTVLQDSPVCPEHFRKILQLLFTFPASFPKMWTP